MILWENVCFLLVILYPTLRLANRFIVLMKKSHWLLLGTILFFSGKPVIWFKAVIYRKLGVNLSDQVVLARVNHFFIFFSDITVASYTKVYDSEKRVLKKSIWSVQICAAVTRLSLFLQLWLCFSYGVRLKPSGQQLMDKDHTKIITIIPHLLVWPLFLPLFAPWKINTLILFYAFSKWVCLIFFFSCCSPVSPGRGGRWLYIL